MPVYDSAPIVIDLGTAYTKLGFAAEAFPRAIISTEIRDVNTGVNRNLFESNTSTEFRDQLIEFIQILFFKYALVSPKERKIVIVENILCPTYIREILAEVLFRHFEVLSILFVPTHLVVLTTLAIDTALVIDIGYKEVTIIPVYSGVQVLHAWQAQPLAAEAVHNEIRKQLKDLGYDYELSEEIIEDIKARLCFVTNFERATKYRNNDPPQPCPSIKYPINGTEIIDIPGTLRETAFEVLFPVDNDRLGLPYIILDAILKCPVDMRKQLADNIFLIGGTTMISGLSARLKSELFELIKNNYYADKLFLTSFKFHTAQSKANFTAWLGGSIYGGTDTIQTRSLTREQYAKTSKVPDWNILDNRIVPSY